MKVKKVIILAVVLLFLGVVAFGGGYLFKSLDENNLATTEKSNNTVEETENLTDENEPGSETMHDNVAKSDVDEEENNKDNCIEKGHPCEKHMECFTDSEYQMAIEDCEQRGLPIYENNDEEEIVEDDTEEDFIEEGLVVYYPFDEDIKDYAGNDIDATNHNAYFVDGKNGKALKFNGKNSFVHVPLNINPFEMPQMTMAVWVKAEKGSVVVRQIIGNDNDEYDRAIVTDFRGGGKGWSCFAGDGMVLGYEPVVADKWTFIATVYNQDAGKVKLFVDGLIYEKDGKMVDEGTPFILIGARGTTENNSHPFKGVIDEVKIYDYALSDTELNSLYKTGIAKPKTTE